MLLPALQQAKNEAKNITCTNNLKQLGMGMLMYVNDYNSWFPYMNTGDAGTCWDFQIADYVKYKYNTPSAYNGIGPDIFRCPIGTFDANSPGQARGYSMNQHVAGLTNYESVNCRASSKGMSNQQLVITEFHYSDGKQKSTMGAYANYEYLDTGTPMTSPYSLFAFRHKNRANYFEKDGAVLNTSPGVQGKGEDPIWLFYKPGTWWSYYKDGSIH
jgi:hypothetical protein